MGEPYSIDQLIELASEDDEKQLLVDLPAQSQRFLDRWLEDSGVLEICAELGLKTLFWYVVDGGRDSVMLLRAFQQKYGGSMPFVVVRNFGCGSDFSDIDQVIAEAQAAQLLAVVDIPALHPATLQRIDKLGLLVRHQPQKRRWRATEHDGASAHQGVAAQGQSIDRRGPAAAVVPGVH